MKFLTITAFVLSVIVSTLQAQVKQKDPLAAVEPVLKVLQRNGFAGCVLIKRKDDIVIRQGFGKADRTADENNSPEMRFDIGSVTKPVVSAAILKQIESGSLKLTSTLTDLFDEVPTDKRSITVEQLLSHTSGFAKTYDLTKSDVTKRDVVVNELLSLPLANSPGEQYEYSNANYFLLAAVLETSSKTTYEKAIKQLVFAPLKMKTAGFTSDPPQENQISPVRYNDEKALNRMAGWPHTWGHRGATGILCTVDDLAAFVRALQTNTLFEAEMRKEWLTVRKTPCALGWNVLETPNRPKTIIHDGSSYGARSLLAYYPEHDVTLVVLMNTSPRGKLFEWEIMRAVSWQVAKP